jgi:hypothetical protein
MTETTYIIQSSEYRYGHWTPWTCCSPQHPTLDEARDDYENYRSCRYLHECVRLARVVTTWRKIPGVRMSFNAGSRRHVYASKRLRCYSPPTRKDLVVPRGRKLPEGVR